MRLLSALIVIFLLVRFPAYAVHGDPAESPVDAESGADDLSPAERAQLQQYLQSQWQQRGYLQGSQGHQGPGTGILRGSQSKGRQQLMVDANGQTITEFSAEILKAAGETAFCGNINLFNSAVRAQDPDDPYPLLLGPSDPEE